MRTVLLLGILCLPLSSYSQSLDDVFDDGKVSDPTGALKIDLLNLYVGEALLGFEYYVSGVVSAILYAGPRIGDYRVSLFERYLFSGDGDEAAITTNGGFNYQIELRINNLNERRGYYYGLAYHQRSFSLAANSEKASVKDVGLMGGYRLPLTSRLHLDCDFKTLYRFDNDAFAAEYRRVNDLTFTEDNPPRFSGEVNLRLGYEF